MQSNTSHVQEDGSNMLGCKQHAMHLVAASTHVQVNEAVNCVLLTLSSTRSDKHCCIYAQTQLFYLCILAENVSSAAASDLN